MYWRIEGFAGETKGKEAAWKIHAQIGGYWVVGMGWIDVAHCMYKWQALVNTVLNLWVPYNAWSFLTT